MRPGGAPIIMGDMTILPQTAPSSVSDQEFSIAARADFDADELRARVESRLNRLKAEWSKREADRALHRDAQRFLEEDQVNWLWPNEAEGDAHWKAKIKVAFNFVGMALDAVATTYASPPRRVVMLDGDGDGDDVDPAALVEVIQELTQWYEDHFWDYGISSWNEVLGEADVGAMYHGIVAIEPRWRDQLDGNEQDGVELLLYLRHEFEVLPTRLDPRIAEAVVFPVTVHKRVESSSPVGTGGPEKSTPQIEVAHYWDGEVFARLQNWTIDERPPEGVDPDDPRFVDGMFRHGLGYLPVVFVRDGVPRRDFYVPGKWVQLKSQGMAVNKLWTEFGHTLRVQHGYPWTNGRLKNAVLAPDGIIGIDPGSQFGVAAPGANLTGMLSGIQTIIDLFAVSFGMAPGSIRMDPQVAKSGVAIVAERAETERLRAKRLSIWRRVENDLQRKAAGVYEAFSGQAPPQANVDVRHQAPPTTLNREELRTDVEFQRKNRWLGRRRALMTYDPDLTAEEVDLRLQEADQEASAAAGGLFAERPALRPVTGEPLQTPPPPPDEEEEPA